MVAGGLPWERGDRLVGLEVHPVDPVVADHAVEEDDGARARDLRGPDERGEVDVVLLDGDVRLHRQPPATGGKTAIVSPSCIAVPSTRSGSIRSVPFITIT